MHELWDLDTCAKIFYCSLKICHTTKNIRFHIVKLLALASTNLVLDLSNLVTNLAKSSLG